MLSEHGNNVKDDVSASSDSSESAELTPLRAHYLKKELITLQFRRELKGLTTVPRNNISTFSYLGPPFTPPPKDGPRLDLPLLRYMFRNFVLSFPFLAAAPKDFFPDKLQPFMANLLSRNLSSASPLDNDPEQSEEATRAKLLIKLEKNFSVLITSGTKLVEKEDVVRLTQKDLDRLEMLAKKRAARERKLKDKFEINVVCVRTVVEKKRVRSKAHEEFIIRTRRHNQPDVFVSRRYGDFRTLCDELRKAHPTELVPPPPAKDRTYVNVTLSNPPSHAASPLPNHQGFGSQVNRAMSSAPTSPTYIPRQSRAMPGMYSSERNSSADSLQSQSSGSPGSPGPNFGGTIAHPSRLAREKNRLTLRSYLHILLSSSAFVSSPVLKSFLLSGPTHLSEEELEDARRREEADHMREDGRIRFAKEITQRVDGLRDAVRSVKGELLGKDGLTRVFATIKHTPDIRDLPPNYKAVIEWARISMASTVFQKFVAADNASEAFAGLKRIHGMMPYFMLKAALKISNPMAMIRGVLDLFLAQPFGGRSLLQRMFTGSLMEEVKALEEDIDSVRSKVEDPQICEKVKLFVYAPPEIQAIYKADAAGEGMNILTAVLRSGEQPRLSRVQMQRVHRASIAHKVYKDAHPDSEDDDGPEDEDAWLYEDLMLLAKLYARLRDREQLMALIFEGTTADLLKDIITIFYSPLAQVYRAASIADSLGDLQNFINDLIRTVEQTEELSQQDPAKTVQVFIDLIQRHEQAFYTFVHKVHSKGEGLFDSLMRWIERFLALMREGIGEPISLEFLLPHTGQERSDIMKEIDAIARYHYLLKVAHEAKVRRRFGRTQGQSEADAEDEAAAELVNGVVRDLSFGDLVAGDADELAAEVSSSEDDEDSSEEDDSSSSDDSGSGDNSSSDTEESEEGSSTEGGKREGTPTPTRTVSRSHTIGHSPASARSQHQHTPKRSLDVASPSRSRPSGRPLRNSRSMSWARTAKDKTLSALPGARRTDEGREQPAQRSSPVGAKKKKADGPRPPELHHIPKLLPLFVEMMRPLLQTQR
ncbi:uncharacterized protein PHACADRAFT_250075 [Phanerochaete carnosa HHB-10118-sp]|uniref:PX domain-containing protein n=1 Tax=Phanerochaete carnosa (strain HHB-10118-sp) TaxID=650164 RepID=K5V9K4_PHACS|nr:uncharacterized protein PHACADRAFT_250075 [Phanerochaete carnosa HHB-10118-sp]EKM59516.1 hypothetical protein PHACADRAFT_250075 [Phanerochaete carnosa HHB-10118-sp]